MLDKLTSTDFEAHLNMSFRLYSDAAGPLLVELTDVSALDPGGRRPQGVRQQPFSIVFRSPRDVVLPQGIYRLEREALGRLEIFLVPIGPDETGMRYEAVFN